MILTLRDNKGRGTPLLDTALPLGGGAAAVPGNATQAAARKPQIPTLYRGDDPGIVNELTLTLTLRDGDMPLLPAGAGFRVDFPVIVDNADTLSLQLPPGWQAQPAGRDSHSKAVFWVFATAQAVASPVGDFVFGFKGLHGSDTAQPLGSLLITPLNIPGLENHRTGLRCPLGLVEAPQGALRQLALDAAWVGSSSVIVTPPGSPAVNNRLAFSLSNGNVNEPVVQPDGTHQAAAADKLPTISLNLVYANEPIGRGALCSLGLAQQRAAAQAPQLTLRTSSPLWTCEPQQSSSGPYWTLRPTAANRTILGTGADAGVELVFDGVVCDLALDNQGDADITHLCILWVNIPGYRSDGTFLQITKTDDLRVTEFYSEPAHGEPVAWNTEVKLWWRTLGAETSYMSDSLHHEETAQKEHGDDKYCRSVVLDHVSAAREFQVFANRPGKPEAQSERIEFQLLYPALAFTSALELVPNVGITRTLHGVCETVESGYVSPIFTLDLQWEINHPELVEKYTLHYDDSPIEEAVWAATAEKQCRLNLNLVRPFTETTTLRLVAHAKDGANAESSATFSLFEPMSGLTLHVEDRGATRGLMTDWGFLLNEDGNDLYCSYVCRPHPHDLGALSWSLDVDIGNASTQRRIWPKPTQPFSEEGQSSSGSGAGWVAYTFNEGRSCNISSVALVAQGPGQDWTRFPFLTAGGQPAAIKSLPLFLKGWRFVWPATVPGVSIPGDPYGLSVKSFTLRVLDDLSLAFDGDASTFTIYYNYHHSSGFLGLSSSDDPAPCAMGVASFGALQCDQFPLLVATGVLPWLSDGGGNPGQRHMHLSIPLAEMGKTELRFSGSAGLSDPVGLTALPPP